MPTSLTPPLPAPGSWWLEEALAAEAAPPEPSPLAGDVEADVVIVGGGYTGLWTALALLERSPELRVVVLEGQTVGLGPSGRNGGFLHGWWSSLPSLRAALGDEDALEVARASDAVVPAVAEFCERRREDVWLRVGGMLKASAAPAEDEAVERAVEAARELGVPEEAVPLSPEEVRARCGSPRFRRGVLFRDGATVQPARLVRALLRAARDAGVAVHERTPTTRVGDGAVETAGGRVRARAVVVATGAWTSGWGPPARLQATFGSAVCLTEPAPELLAELGWTGGEAIVDGRRFLHYFRTTPDGRVLMGSGSGLLERGARVEAVLDDRAAQARAEAALRRLLPALAGVGIAARWSGPIDVAADRLPFFGTVPGTRIHYGGGYSGNGVGPSWLGGQILASLALGSDDEWTALPLVRRRIRRLPPEPLRHAGGAVARAGLVAVEEARSAGLRPPLWGRAVELALRAVRLPIVTR